MYGTDELPVRAQRRAGGTGGHPDARARRARQLWQGQRRESKAVRSALLESRFTAFRFSGTAAGQKITQLYGDSKAFDETPYVNACDLIFVDGSHAHS